MLPRQRQRLRHRHRRAEAVGDRRHALQRLGLARPEASRQAVGALGFHPDDDRLGAHRLDRRRHAADQPAAADRQHDHVKRRAVLDHLGAAACRTIGHVGVVEGMQHRPHLVARNGLEKRHRRHHVGNQHHLRPQRAAALDAERVGRLRHHHLRMHAAGLRRPGGGKREIAAGKADDAVAPRLVAQPVDSEKRSARLERAGMLEQLQLHVKLGAVGDVGGDPAAAQRQDRRADHPPVELVAGRGDPVTVKPNHAPTLARRCGGVNEIRRASAQVPGDAESLVRSARIRRDSGPRRDPVAVAVASVAQEGPALRQTESPHRLQPFPDTLFQRADSEFVGAPFPDIADHVVQPVAVRREACRRRRGGMPVGGAVGLRKAALPDVAGEEAAVVRFLVAPGKAHVAEPAARSMLPFRLARQPAADPGRIGGGVVPGHMNRWMVGAAGILGPRAMDGAPGGAIDAPPPFASDHPFGRAGRLRNVGPEDEGPAPAFRLGDIGGRLDEGGEFGVGDGGGAEKERFHRDPPHRPLAVIGKLGPPGADKGPPAGNLHRMRRDTPRRAGRHGGIGDSVAGLRRRQAASAVT